MSVFDWCFIEGQLVMVKTGRPYVAWNKEVVAIGPKASLFILLWQAGGDRVPVKKAARMAGIKLGVTRAHVSRLRRRMLNLGMPHYIAMSGGEGYALHVRSAQRQARAEVAGAAVEQLHRS